MEPQDGGALAGAPTPNSLGALGTAHTSNMTFGHALHAAKHGLRIARAGWNGKGMWVACIAADHWGLGSGIPFDDGRIDAPRKRAWLGVRTADNEFVPWTVSQSDALAEDWCVVSTPATEALPDPAAE